MKLYEIGTQIFDQELTSQIIIILNYPIYINWFYKCVQYNCNSQIVSLCMNLNQIAGLNLNHKEQSHIEIPPSKPTNPDRLYLTK